MGEGTFVDMNFEFIEDSFNYRFHQYISFMVTFDLG